MPDYEVSKAAGSAAVRYLVDPATGDVKPEFDSLAELHRALTASVQFVHTQTESFGPPGGRQLFYVNAMNSGRAKRIRKWLKHCRRAGEMPQLAIDTVNWWKRLNRAERHRYGSKINRDLRAWAAKKKIEREALLAAKKAAAG